MGIRSVEGLLGFSQTSFHLGLSVQQLLGVGVVGGQPGTDLRALLQKHCTIVLKGLNGAVLGRLLQSQNIKTLPMLGKQRVLGVVLRGNFPQTAFRGSDLFLQVPASPLLGVDLLLQSADIGFISLLFRLKHGGLAVFLRGFSVQLGDFLADSLRLYIDLPQGRGKLLRLFI